MLAAGGRCKSMHCSRSRCGCWCGWLTLCLAVCLSVCLFVCSYVVCSVLPCICCSFTRLRSFVRWFCCGIGTHDGSANVCLGIAHQCVLVLAMGVLLSHALMLISVHCRTFTKNCSLFWYRVCRICRICTEICSICADWGILHAFATLYMPPMWHIHVSLYSAKIAEQSAKTIWLTLTYLTYALSLTPSGT